MYRHYSFDLWLTLIRSNPSYKMERARYFFQHFNFKQKSLEDVVAAFRTVDLMCNQINEAVGGNIDAEEMCLMVIAQINDHTVDLRNIDMARLCNDLDNLTLEYMPVLYCDNTLDVLATLKSKPGTTISLLSNTGFIKGKTLRNVLNHLGIDQYLDFQLYSDEESCSKPNAVFYEKMLHKTRTLQADIALHEIIHIGDNEWADVGGATKAGIHSLLINTNETKITHLLKHENEHLLIT